MEHLSELIAMRVRDLRDKLGLSRKELAQIAGLPLDTLRTIERAKNIANTATLVAIAKALNTSTSYLLGESDVVFREDPVSGRIPILTGVDSLHIVDLQQLEVTNFHEWNRLGDQEDAMGNWMRALYCYQRGISLSMVQDYPWAECMVVRIAQMHINLGQYTEAQNILSYVQFRITTDAWQASTQLDETLHISGLIAEKRGWIAIHCGRYNEAEKLFSKAQSISLSYGDLRLQSTGHHFRGNTFIQSQIPLLFSEFLHTQSPISGSVHEGIHEIRKALQMDKDSDPNVAFGLRLEAIGLFLLNQIDGAKEQIDKSVALLNTTGWHIDQAHSLVWKNLMQMTLTASETRKYEDLLTILSELCEILSNQRHPYTYVESVLVLLVAKHQAGYFRKDGNDRNKCTDLCIIVLLLHYQPTHPYFQLAKELLLRFIGAMNRTERLEYISSLAIRIMYFQDSFEVLKKFLLLPSNIVYAVIELLKSPKYSGQSAEYWDLLEGS